MINQLKFFIKRKSNFHIDSGKPNILLFSSPRSGSTWLMELLSNQKRAKPINEPFNIRDLNIKKYTGVSGWQDLIDINKKQNHANYVNAITSGKLSFKNPSPISSYYKPIIDHAVVKILHACDNMMNDIISLTNSKSIYLVRHPIPVAQSRKQLPRLESFVYSKKFMLPKDLQKFSESVFNNGSTFEKSILDWCYQNYYGLREENPQYFTTSYEKLVVEPEPILDYLVKEGFIADKESAIASLVKPSKSTIQSSGDRKEMLKESAETNSRDALILKWQNSVTDEQILSTQNILDHFEISFYRADSPYPEK